MPPGEFHQLFPLLLEKCYSETEPWAASISGGAPFYPAQMRYSVSGRVVPNSADLIMNHSWYIVASWWGGERFPPSPPLRGCWRSPKTFTRRKASLLVHSKFRLEMASFLRDVKNFMQASSSFLPWVVHSFAAQVLCVNISPGVTL